MMDEFEDEDDDVEKMIADLMWTFMNNEAP